VSSELRIRKAVADDIIAVGPRLRGADVAELAAFPGLEPALAMMDAFDSSSSAWTLEVFGRPEAMFGVCPASAVHGVGVPWFLGTPALDSIPFPMVRLGRSVVKLMLQTYPTLRNVVDARYGKALRWAQLIGFELGEPIPIGKNGELFIPIERVR
jgi:hypothetical protein